MNFCFIFEIKVFYFKNETNEITVSKRPSQTVQSILRDMRLARGETLEDVAKASGTTRAHISAIETGRVQNPSLRILLALATHFGCSLDSLVGHGRNTVPSLRSDPLDHLLLSELRRLKPDKKRVLLRLVKELKSDSKPRETPGRRFA